MMIYLIAVTMFIIIAILTELLLFVLSNHTLHLRLISLLWTCESFSIISSVPLTSLSSSAFRSRGSSTSYKNQFLNMREKSDSTKSTGVLLCTLPPLLQECQYDQMNQLINFNDRVIVSLAINNTAIPYNTIASSTEMGLEIDEHRISAISSHLCHPVDPNKSNDDDKKSMKQKQKKSDSGGTGSEVHLNTSHKKEYSLLSLRTESRVYKEGEAYQYKQFRLTLSTMLRNPFLYCTTTFSSHCLLDWIEHHRLIGVEHFYIYDNNSTDLYSDTLSSGWSLGEILNLYIQAGIVTVIEWPWNVGGSDNSCAQQASLQHTGAYNTLDTSLSLWLLLLLP